MLMARLQAKGKGKGKGKGKSERGAETKRVVAADRPPPLRSGDGAKARLGARVVWWERRG